MDFESGLDSHSNLELVGLVQPGARVDNDKNDDDYNNDDYNDDDNNDDDNNDNNGYSSDTCHDMTYQMKRQMKSFQTPRTIIVISLVVVTLMVLGRTVFDADDVTDDTLATTQQHKSTTAREHNSTKSDSHNNVHSHDSSSSKTKRHNNGTLLIFEKVGKTGTTSLRDHLFEVMNVDDGKFWCIEKKNRNKTAVKDICFRSANHFSNKTNPEVYKGNQNHFWSDTQVYPPCSCETDLFMSHMTRLPKKMDHFLGRCDLTNVDVLSVIPLRFDTRIDSEIQYGHNILSLDPTKSILDNSMGYKFNPYDTYGHNSLATRTCIFDFLDGTFDIPHSMVTAKVRGEKDRFECTTKVCEESIEFVKREEAKHIQRLQEKFPICDVQELQSLLLLPLADTGKQGEGQRE